jgi:hypothetical protein
MANNKAEQPQLRVVNMHDVLAAHDEELLSSGEYDGVMMASPELISGTAANHTDTEIGNVPRGNKMGGHFMRASIEYTGTNPDHGTVASHKGN